MLIEGWVGRGRPAQRFADAPKPIGWFGAPPPAGRKVRAPQGSVTGNTRPLDENLKRNRATETSPRRRRRHPNLSDGLVPRLLRGVKRSNLYAEQGQIGDEGNPFPVINLG